MAEETKATITREFLAERDVRIFKMKQAGVASQEIARRFGVSVATVGRSVNRQLEKLNSEALLAYPEVLRMELERLDQLQSAIWPMTQHRRVTLDDGTEVSVEPASAHRAYVVSKLRFPNRAHCSRTICSIHGATLHVYSCLYVVTGPEICK